MKPPKHRRRNSRANNKGAYEFYAATSHWWGGKVVSSVRIGILYAIDFYEKLIGSVASRVQNVNHVGISVGLEIENSFNLSRDRAFLRMGRVEASDKYNRKCFRLEPNSHQNQGKLTKFSDFWSEVPDKLVFAGFSESW